MEQQVKQIDASDNTQQRKPFLRPDVNYSSENQQKYSVSSRFE